jgi:hypothetical protein
MSATIGRTLATHCTIPQCALWIETCDVAEVEGNENRAPSQASVAELLTCLRLGRLASTGCVDGAERRSLSSAEWNDYQIDVLLGQQAVRSMFRTRMLSKQNSHVVAVRSREMVPVKGVNLRIGHSLALYPSLKSVCHRFIENVLIVADDLLREFPNPNELHGLKHSDQVRILMDRYHLGPEYGGTPTQASNKIIAIIRDLSLTIHSEDAMKKAVQREFSKRKKARKSAEISIP